MTPARDGNAGDAATGHHLLVRDARKNYGPVAALAGVHFEAQPGEFLVLLGPSGSGKSTLIRSLAGVETLDSGQIALSGRTVSDGRRQVASEHRDLAMVFQDYALWPHLNVAGNVGYALRRRRHSAAERHRRIGEALERVGLANHLHRYPHQLSGGEQQRVGLARAIVAEPRLLLFDEPLSNLDADLRERLRVEIATLTRESGATAVYITHDQGEAFALADKIGVLQNGQLLQLATPEQLYQQPATPAIARFTGIAGECTATATSLTSDRVRVRIGHHSIDARAIGSLGENRGVRLLIRPAATSLTPAVIAGQDMSTAGALPATVTDVAYRGRGYDHVVHCAAGFVSAVHSPTAYPRGGQVQLRLDPNHCLAYPDEQADRVPMDGAAAIPEPRRAAPLQTGRSAQRR